MTEAVSIRPYLDRKAFIMNRTNNSTNRNRRSQTRSSVRTILICIPWKTRRWTSFLWAPYLRKPDTPAYRP